ncbi:unnamed protein product [Caenorhabditis angaria]|uniref:Interleukin n=1 Tax=Caenorhabditis angaria TaxID=860376 RepID=A0A9P1N2Y0_9PELO|nr:unnamed protein product [Caenorhabditis angaria]
MYLLPLVVILALTKLPVKIGAFENNVDLRTMEMIKNHPSHLLTVLIGECKKNPNSCPMSIESMAHYILNTIEVLINFDMESDEESIREIEKFADTLSKCKDAECLMNFEIEQGIKIEKIMREVSKILADFPEEERSAWQHSILKPPHFYNRDL